MGTHYANLDYLNLFLKLQKIQTSFSEDIFINKIKFKDAEEVWKKFNQHGNNLLNLFPELKLPNQIILIKYLDYYLLDNDEKIELFKERAEKISVIIKDFKEKHKSKVLSKIELYGFYDMFFNQLNKEQILIDFGATFKYIEIEKETIDNFDQNEEILRNICDWLNNFNSLLKNNHKDIWDKYNTSFLSELKEGEAFNIKNKNLMEINTGDKPFIEQGATSEIEIDINAGKQFYESVSNKPNAEDYFKHH